MLFTDSVFIGIDPTSSHKTFTYAALDKNLNLVALADGELDDVTAFAAGQQFATVAINAPANVNRGLVREKMKNEMLTPHKIRAAEYRLAEYELREHGIAVSGTPASVGICPAWIQVGFSLYRKLEKMGFKKYSAEKQTHQMIETHPHACYCVLADDTPLPKPTLEGKLQRQLLLYERGVKIKDPMDFFEEITRHKMIKGIWPLDLLYLPEQLDALVAAYTAWLTVHKPEQTISVGDAKEGKIFLPASELREKY
jgi:hypothetical protein